MDWHRIGSDWQIGKFVSERKIGPRLALIGTGLASDWHGLARIGQDWQIGEFESERKIDPRLAQDWHGLARIGLIGSDWPGLADWRICVQTKNWRRIGIRLAQDWH